MADFALPPISVSPALLQAKSGSAVAPSASDLAKRAGIEKASKDFEASFLSVMLGQMFEGVNEGSGPFGGGAGESAFKSFMTDAMAKQMVRSGGVGLAATVQKEMLKLQGLS
ncbi:MAG TPA: rod-binding protein [Phenylobacterium sp.]|nr:rod-binding protein [Phenylobacterium sp.]